jgi:hypothetical protein
MSNQRVVVLTDEEIRSIKLAAIFGAPSAPEPSAMTSMRVKLDAALEHPGGITKEHVERGARAFAGDQWEGLSPKDQSAVRLGFESGLLAALFPGDGQ